MTDETKMNATSDSLDELIKQIDHINIIAAELYKLRNDNMFRFLSKNARNELLNGLMEKSGSVEDAAKAAHRVLKKIKRERLPEEVADLLLCDHRRHAIAFAPVVVGVPVSEDDDRDLNK